MSEGTDGNSTDSAAPSNPLAWQILWATTGVFGFAAWAVGLAAVVPGFAVPLAVLAGAVALVGLLPGQAVRGWLAVAVAVTAFANVISTTVTGNGTGWVLIVVDVLVALQVVVAVAALLLEPRGPAGTRPAPENDYDDVYAQYVQAYWEYAQQYGSDWPDQHSATSAADATGEARGTVAGTAGSDQDAWSDMQRKYAQHVSPVTPAPPVRRADGGAPTDTGMPGVDRADRAYEGHGQAAPPSAPTSPGAY